MRGAGRRWAAISEQMTVYVPYTELKESTQVYLSHCKIWEDSEIFFVDVSNGPWAYIDYFQDRWDECSGFVNLEHDVVPWPGAVSALLCCSEPWCFYGYSPFRLGEKMEARLVDGIRAALNDPKIFELVAHEPAFSEFFDSDGSLKPVESWPLEQASNSSWFNKISAVLFDGYAPTGLMKFSPDFIKAIPNVWREMRVAYADSPEPWRLCDNWLLDYVYRRLHYKSIDWGGSVATFSDRGIAPHQNWPSVLNANPQPEGGFPPMRLLEPRRNCARTTG